jgi:hypothetical protein
VLNRPSPEWVDAFVESLLQLVIAFGQSNFYDSLKANFIDNLQVAMIHLSDQRSLIRADARNKTNKEATRLKKHVAAIHDAVKLRGDKNWDFRGCVYHVMSTIKHKALRKGLGVVGEFKAQDGEEAAADVLSRLFNMHPQHTAGAASAAGPTATSKDAEPPRKRARTRKRLDTSNADRPTYRGRDGMPAGSASATSANANIPSPLFMPPAMPSLAPRLTSGNFRKRPRLDETVMYSSLFPNPVAQDMFMSSQPHHSSAPAAHVKSGREEGRARSAGSAPHSQPGDGARRRFPVQVQIAGRAFRVRRLRSQYRPGKRLPLVALTGG